MMVRYWAPHARCSGNFLETAAPLAWNDSLRLRLWLRLSLGLGLGLGRRPLATCWKKEKHKNRNNPPKNLHTVKRMLYCMWYDLWVEDLYRRVITNDTFHQQRPCQPTFMVRKIFVVYSLQRLSDREREHNEVHKYSGCFSLRIFWCSVWKNNTYQSPPMAFCAWWPIPLAHF